MIRGNTLVIPIDNSLLYVEPIYFQAEAAAYPELRLLAVMHGDNLSYADTFEKALQGLLTQEEKRPSPMPAQTLAGEKMISSELIRQAKQASRIIYACRERGDFLRPRRS